MPLEVCSLIDECQHPALIYDNYWQQCLRPVHLAAAGAAQQINYAQLDVVVPAVLFGANRLSEARRRQIAALYGAAVTAHVAVPNPVPDVLLWRGHGALVNDISNNALADPGNGAPPTATLPRLYYAHTGMACPPAGWAAVGPPSAYVSGKDIGRAADFPTVPATLWYSESCYGAWEVSFARHVISRGCRFYIGSRISWNGHLSLQFLGALADHWRASGYNPDNLEASFRAIAPAHAAAYPVLIRATEGCSPNSYKYIHAAPPGAYGCCPSWLGVGNWVSVELI